MHALRMTRHFAFRNEVHRSYDRRPIHGNLKSANPPKKSVPGHSSCGAPHLEKQSVASFLTHALCIHCLFYIAGRSTRLQPQPGRCWWGTFQQSRRQAGQGP